MKKLIACLLTTMMAFSQPVFTPAADAPTIAAGGSMESIYADLTGCSADKVTGVSYSGDSEGALSGDDLKYLVRDKEGGGVTIDIPGVKAGTYTLKVSADGHEFEVKDIKVNSYDRSGYAHFNYTEGVGAYRDDGTIKDKAIVLYVNDDNKNSVQLTYGSDTVTGIGNILNSAGAAASGQKNTNGGILKKLCAADIPLVVRVVGTVSNTGLYKKGSFDPSKGNQIEGLTAYASKDFGGSTKDNGGMASMQYGKNITIEGIGDDAVIDGWGFSFSAKADSVKNGYGFEVRNLTFINTPEDGVGMDGNAEADDETADWKMGVERCWIHNNSFYCPTIQNPIESDKGQGDGSVDFKVGQYFTCSYNYFDGCHKTCLLGGGPKQTQFNVTYHHNYWKGCDQRGPLSRNANVHMYNNYVLSQKSYAQNARYNAYIFSEYNVFEKSKRPQLAQTESRDSKDATAPVYWGVIKSYKDSYTDCTLTEKSDSNAPATTVASRDEKVENTCGFAARNIDYSSFDTDGTLSYIPGGNYLLSEDYEEIKNTVTAAAGVMKKDLSGASSGSSGEGSGNSGEGNGNAGEGGGNSGDDNGAGSVTDVLTQVKAGDINFTVGTPSEIMYTGAKVTLPEIKVGDKTVQAGDEISPGILLSKIRYKNNKNVGTGYVSLVLKASDASMKGAVIEANKALKTGIPFAIVPRTLSADELTGEAVYDTRKGKLKFSLKVNTGSAKLVKLKFNSKKPEKSDIILTGDYIPGSNAIEITGSNRFKGTAIVKVIEK